MQIKLYKNLSEVNTIGKTLTEENVRTGTLKDGCSVLSPSVVLTGENLSNFNYMYIPEFHRYYFITGITSVKKGLWQIDGHCDVLESYKDSIKENVAIIKRQESIWDLYLNDEKFKAESTNKTATILFPNNLFNTVNFILTAAGMPTESEGVK